VATFAIDELARLPDGDWPSDMLATTSAGRCFGFGPSAAGSILWTWDGVVGRPFDALVPMRDHTTLFWSGDRAHVAFMAARAGQQFVIHDGLEDPPFDQISRSVPPTFSSDGSRLAYAVLDGERRRLMLDGVLMEHEPIGPIAATFSPDGRRLAYTLLVMPDERHRIVLDGSVLPDDVGLPNDRGVLQFSPDSRRFAYYTIDGSTLEARWVIDGVPGRTFTHTPLEMSLARIQKVSTLGPRVRAGFSPDSRRFAYWADVKEKGVAVIEDDAIGPIVKAAGEPVFSPDSRHLAYTVQLFSNAHAIVRDGAVGREVPGAAASFLFSPDSLHLAATTEHEDGGLFRKRRVYRLTLDDEVVLEEAGEDASRWPVFSPDSHHLAWWLQRKKDAVVYLDGRPVIQTPALWSEPVITAANTVVCAVGLDSGLTVSVDAALGPIADRLRLPTVGMSGGPLDPANTHFRVSADGRHVSWAGQFDGVDRPVLDNELGPTVDFVFDYGFDEGRAYWVARRGSSLIRITADI